MNNEIDWQYFLSFAEECRKKYIPVIREQSAKLLCEYVKLTNAKNILEIGTAVGYSGTLMLLSASGSKLTTIDNNADMCKTAKQNFVRQKQYIS